MTDEQRNWKVSFLLEAKVKRDLKVFLSAINVFFMANVRIRINLIWKYIDCYQKMLTIDYVTFWRVSYRLESPLSRKMEPSAGFLKCLSSSVYIWTYSASFLFASSRSLLAFSYLLLRTSTSWALLSSNSLIVLLCCSLSLSSLFLRFAVKSDISWACLFCSSLRLVSRIVIFFWRASIWFFKIFSLSPEESPSLVNLSLNSSRWVSSSLFCLVRSEISLKVLSLNY